MIVRRILAASIFCACIPAWAETPNPKVIERYKQMLSANPSEGTALDRLWKIHVDQNTTAQLIDEYRAGGTFGSEMVLGHLLRKAARPAEAGAAYERAAKLDEKNAQPWIASGTLHRDAGRPREAAEAFAKAAEVLPESDPQQSDILLQLGAAWLTADEPAKATEAWEKTIARDPANLALRRKLADTCVQNRFPDRAILHLEFLEKNAPPEERAQALQQLARIHQAAGDQDLAIDALERALAYTAPGNWLRAELQSQLIRLHQRYHRTGELEERWKENVARNPRDIGAYLQLLDLYERTGDLDRQKEWLQKLIALAPKTPEYRLKLARLLAQSDDLDGAVALYDPLLKEQPGNVDLVFERARLDIQRDATAAARARIAALLSAKKNDEALRSKALAFYETHRLYDLVEAHLKTDAAAGAEEPVLALANYYFAQHREADAQATLDRLVPASAPKEKRAAAFFKQAQILKAQNDLPGAAKVLHLGIELAAHPREMWLLLGDIEAALGHQPATRAAYEQAIALSSTTQETTEADQKLFENLRSEPEKTGASRSAPSAISALAESSEPNAALQSYLLGITRRVAEKPTVDGWLRVARWHLWSRNTRSALEYAQKARALDPASLPTLEFLVKLASAEPQSGAARTHLDELIRLDPTRKSEYRRRAGQIELQAGHVEEALRVFGQLADENPGSTEALTDLALTQQRAEQWEKALATWTRINALTPASRKKEVIGSLLRAYERLKQPAAAAALLLAQIDSFADEKDQFTTFQDLLNLCSKNDLVPWLRDELEKRRKTHADDYFTEVALGRILQLTGNKSAAFEVLADASFAAPNQAEALPELVRSAEELRKPDAAVRLQAQLLRIVPQTGPDGFLKLAQLQEKNGDIEPASQTWAKIAARFPRDSAALERAVEFEIAWGNAARATELLRRIRTLEPTNLRALAQLAQLDIEAGQTAEAHQCLEQILARSAPEQPGEALRIPGVKPEDAGRLQTAYLATVRSRRARPATEVMRALRSFWAEDAAPGRSDRDVRLSAIRDLARMVQLKNEPAALAAWVSRWRTTKGAPTETLWALYFSGASGPMLDHLDALRSAAPADPQAKQAFIWLALETGELVRLSSWLQDKIRTPVERDYLLIALGQHLQARAGKVQPGLIENLFPKNYHLRLWQAATLFGAHGCFREATQLGRRVFDSLSTQRAGYGLELAHWHLYLGEVDAARQVLRDSIKTPGESYDASVYSAVRELYLLLPTADRASFAESYLQDIDDQRQPLHAALSGALLAGLSGQEDEAHTKLKRLLDLGVMAHIDADETGNSASRYWDFLLSTGAHLQGWKLDQLASFLWESALDDDALIRLTTQTQGEQLAVRTNDLRARLTALRLLRASPFDAAEIMETFERHGGPDGLAQVGEALESAGAFSQAILVHRTVWEREPSNPHTLRNLLAACRTADDSDTLEEVLTRCVREGIFRTNDAANRDLAMQLADVLDRRGAYAQARGFLGAAVDSTPTDARMLLRLAQLHERAGRLGDAEAGYRRLVQLESSNVPARVALAGILEAEGNIPGAIESLEKSGGADVDAKLVRLYSKADRIDDAITALERISPPSHIAVALQLADDLAKKGDRSGARSVLLAAMVRSPDPQTNLPLQSKVVTFLQTDDDRGAVAREVRRLRRMAGDLPEMVGSYYDLMIRESARLKWDTEFVRELSEDWDDGAGTPAAGVALFEWQLQVGGQAAAQATWQKLLARDDITELLWLKVLADSAKAELPEMAVEAHARLARQTPLNFQRTLDWIRALHEIGRDAEALLATGELRYRAFLNDEIAGRVAELFAELNDAPVARALFADLVAGDPTGRNFRVHLAYAQLLLAQGEEAAARQSIRIAFRNPRNREFGEFIQFLETCGRLREFDREIAGLELRPPALTEARRALLVHFEKRKDVAAVVALIDEHPDVMESGLGSRLRALAQTGTTFEIVGALLERIVAQSPQENTEPAAELAALYGAWAEADLAALQEETALAHLRRGHELKPDLFSVMQRLAEMLAKGADVSGAARVVQDFLTSSQNAAELEKARKILARIER